MEYNHRVELRDLAGEGPVRLGLEGLLGVLRGKRVGFIANHTSVAADLSHLGALLHARDDVGLDRFLAPEHGLWGDVYAGDHIETSTDPLTGLPVHSLYDRAKRGLEAFTPTPEMLAGLDVVLFDLQDVGARYYTYVSTLEMAMEAAAAAGIGVVVLDRPNPIGGVVVDGDVSLESERTFTAIHPLPVQHGMTVGELARLFNAERRIGCELTVVEMEGWRRGMFFDDTGLPWVTPSPNMPSLATAIVYTCANVVGANLSVGLGTTKPFEYVGAPWVAPFAYAGALNARRLPGVRFRPAYFHVHYGPYAGQRCAGVQIHVTERRDFLACQTAAHMTCVARELYPNRAWPQDPKVGRHRIPASGETADDVIASWQADLARFRETRARYLLYGD
ncbi:MAG TPA: DUF1343 domain-containing protein [Chloroflexota bacterium]|nr:DUF1343 domain-containing protein [Chloroflexota bacterium]